MKPRQPKPRDLKALLRYKHAAGSREALNNWIDQAEEWEREKKIGHLLLLEMYRRYARKELGTKSDWAAIKGYIALMAEVFSKNTQEAISKSGLTPLKGNSKEAILYDLNRKLKAAKITDQNIPQFLPRGAIQFFKKLGIDPKDALDPKFRLKR
jgi:hypothetical protein